MKQNHVFHYLGVAIASVAFSVTADAQGLGDDENKANTDRRFGGKTLPKIMQIFDLDSSNHLDPTEFLEFKKAKKEAGGEIGEDEIDTNEDGEVTDEEIEEAKEKNLERLVETQKKRFADVNTDGEDGLTVDEFKNIPGLQSLKEDVVLAMFDFFDDDDDTVVSEDEFLAALADNKNYGQTRGKRIVSNRGGKKPDHAGRPDHAGKPDDTGKPDDAGKPNGNGKPDDAGKPNGNGKPDDAGKPNGNGKPDHAGKPNGNGKPDGEEPDGEEPDGGEPDGGEPDGEEPDGEEPDGEEPDGEEPDGEEPDGGEPEGEEPDGV